MSERLPFALKLSGFHLSVSLLIAAVVAALVFGLWYPRPFAAVEGGLVLFALVVAVDVVCGPLMTLILADPKKSRRALIFDLSLIGLVQLSALIYGMHAVFVARPVYFAFEGDRFNVAAAVQVRPEDLAQAAPEFRSLPKTGPRRVTLQCPRGDALGNLSLSLSGIPPTARPQCWQEYDPARDDAAVQKAMKPLRLLLRAHPENADAIVDIASDRGGVDALFFLPFTTDKSFSWSAVLNDKGKIVDYLRADGFISAAD